MNEGRGDRPEAKVLTSVLCGQIRERWTRVKELQAKIGELTMERDFLDRGLARFDPKRDGR